MKIVKMEIISTLLNPVIKEDFFQILWVFMYKNCDYSWHKYIIIIIMDFPCYKSSISVLAAKGYVVTEGD